MVRSHGGRAEKRHQGGLMSGKEVRGEREVRGGGAWGEKRNKVGWGGEGVTCVYMQ